MMQAKKISMVLIALGLVWSKVGADNSTMDPAMEKAIKLGSPSDAHKIFELTEGSWNAVVRGRVSPTEKFQESKGSAQNAMILGGRFLRQKFKGEWGGQVFEGEGTTGYDNLKDEYESIWIDNFMTGMMKGTGSYDAKTKTLHIGGTFSCPMTGNKADWYRSEWKIVDMNTNIYSSYGKDSSGKEFKSMEITFRRAHQ